MIDLYNFPDVIATGQLSLGSKWLEAGSHRLTLEMVGANPVAVGGDKLGVDHLRVTAE